MSDIPHDEGRELLDALRTLPVAEHHPDFFADLENRLRQAAATPARSRWLTRVGPSALVAAALLAIGVGIGAWFAPASPAAAGDTFAGPLFQSEPGWTTVASVAVPVTSSDVPTAWASTFGFQSEASLDGTPTNTLSAMPPDGILIVATSPLPACNPAPDSNPNFPDAPLPLSLANAHRESTFEGQPSPNTVRYVVRVRLNDQYFGVDVYFGTPVPSVDEMATAEAELQVLVFPPAGPTGLPTTQANPCGSG